ncbi:hypothetical protein NADFUDRAFT_50906 [Nadsonia fulvescens var. elongata DSM 6958]|uniref:t-SNARE coiled-coil homology domain-containing protein n=1 Tax=Nadsonia fulvescens var. elongata DSM 6958 TaxID=857566 RepID=A0A1E3PJN1_9ASCO|nr:hypothetical protein NADFUDRAFT_50906 [Nadsonia fulvescens var. elongata DSM 6958]
MSQAYQREEQNNHRLEELASKLSSLRNVTNDIHARASDYSMIDQASDSMSELMTSVKGSAVKLTRSIQAGHPIMKMVGLALAIFFLFYMLYKFFG